MANASILLAVFLYVAIMLGLGIYASKMSQKAEGGFAEEYFLGGRSMGGFVLAMTMVATYTSGSSFIGGPGVAYTRGLSWVLVAVIQIPVILYTLGVLGKKYAIVARRINAITVTDYLYERYKSDAVSIMTSIVMIVFFIALMVAQFIAGARLFESITGYSYQIGLAIFGIIVVIYTAIGGFKAVIFTDAFQGVMMLIGALSLLFMVTHAGGGVSNIIDTLTAQSPDYVEPLGGGVTTPWFLFSNCFIVGFALLGLPQTGVRCMAYKDSKSLHRAIILGSTVVAIMIFSIHLTGAFGRAIITEPLASSDLVLPTLILDLFHPIIAGIFIAGPLAAVMSTVDSLLILASADIVTNLYKRYTSATVTEEKIKKLSFIVTLIIGLAVFAFALYPPSLIVWVNYFAFAGLEVAFLFPVVLGLYWKKANSTGVLTSMVISLAVYIYLMATKFSFNGMHNVVIGVAVSAIAFFIGNRFGKNPDDETLIKFYGEV